jgi:hypothetical protein
MTRRSARSQSLPRGEAELLRTLTGAALWTRASQLYHAGWTLQSVGDALEPPRSRTTVRAWVTRPHAPAPLDRPVPRPRLRTPEGGYVSRRPVSPGIDAATRARIAELAPVARRYRSRTASDSAFAVANRALTDLCRELHYEHVSVTELAAAAGVTYRAMARRLGRTA